MIIDVKSKYLPIWIKLNLLYPKTPATNWSSYQTVINLTINIPKLSSKHTERHQLNKKQDKKTIETWKMYMSKLVMNAAKGWAIPTQKGDPDPDPNPNKNSKTQWFFSAWEWQCQFKLDCNVKSGNQTNTKGCYVSGVCLSHVTEPTKFICTQSNYNKIRLHCQSVNASDSEFLPHIYILFPTCQPAHQKSSFLCLRSSQYTGK